LAERTSRAGSRLWTKALVLAFVMVSSQARADMREDAAAHEAKGEWAAAATIYANILAADRSDVDARDHYQLCIRHIHQARRLRDAALRDDLRSRGLQSSLDAYEEIVRVVKSIYLDEKKATPSLLFQYGLQEYRFAFEDPAFVNTYLSGTDEYRIRDYINDLNRYLDRSVGSVKEARTLVREIALDAVEKLQLPEGVVIVEFAYGACNALDEHTACLAPSDYKDLLNAQGAIGVKTVEDVRLLDTSGVGYFKISGFGKNTRDDVREAVIALSGMKMHALVVDLRGCGGGSFHSAIDTAELFLPEGVIANTETRLKKEFKETYKANNPDAFNVPIVLLVDGGTASAAELFAAALRDNENRHALLVGRTTFGKNSIQVVIPVNRLSSGVRITIARFLPPGKHDFSGCGLIPNIMLEKVDGMTLEQILLAELLEAERRAAGLIMVPE
jgi:hypothetical protein